MKRGQHKKGFTIVELLIVIVVIAILAAITIVAYNGIQTRSKNAKTVAAVAAYSKAIGLYKADNGTHPQVSSCLGVGYAGGVCRTDAGWNENGGNFNTSLLSQYLPGTPPTPALVPADYNGTLTITGAFYAYNNASYNANGGGFGVIILGTSTCPSIQGTTLSSSTSTADGNVLCRYAATT